MATMREIGMAISDDMQTRHPDATHAEVRLSYARVYMSEAIDVAFRLEGELMLADSPDAVADLVQQFDQLSDAWVDLMR